MEYSDLNDDIISDSDNDAYIDIDINIKKNNNTDKMNFDKFNDTEIDAESDLKLNWIFSTLSIMNILLIKKKSE
jgi:hypothetical protein